MFYDNDKALTVKRKKDIEEKIKDLFQNNIKESANRTGNIREYGKNSIDRYKGLKNRINKDQYFCMFDGSFLEDFEKLLDDVYIASNLEVSLFENFNNKYKRKDAGEAIGEEKAGVTVGSICNGLFKCLDNTKNIISGTNYKNSIEKPIKSFLNQAEKKYKELEKRYYQVKDSTIDKIEGEQKRFERDLSAFANFLFTNCKDIQLQVKKYIDARMEVINKLNKTYGFDNDFIVDEELGFFRVLYGIAGVQAKAEMPNDGLRSSDSGLLYKAIDATVNNLYYKYDDVLKTEQ